MDRILIRLTDDNCTVDEHGGVWSNGSNQKTVYPNAASSGKIKSVHVKDDSKRSTAGENKESTTEDMKEHEVSAEKNPSVEALENTALTLHATTEVVKVGAEKGATAVEGLVKTAKDAEEASQLEGAAKMAKGTGEVMHGVGVVASWVSAGVATYEAIEHPTVRNISKAVLETTWAGLQTFAKVNPTLAAVVTAVEVANAIYKWW